MAIYLDNAATTPVAAEVLSAMLPFFSTHYGNASAKYYELGKVARRAVNKARQQIARLLNAEISADEDQPSEIIFTSGATESNNWVMQNAPLMTGKKHLITSAVEHHSILDVGKFMVKYHGCRLTILPVDNYGIVKIAELANAISDDTALISVMLANNETGTLQPLAEIAALAKKQHILLHTDAVQAMGKIPVDVKKLDVDFLSLSGHKFYAPKGIGALYCRRGIKLPALMNGGGQEKSRRAGTLNVPAIVGLGQAAELAISPAEAQRQSELVEELWNGLSKNIPHIYRNGHSEKRLPNILNVRVDGAEGEAILLRLDMCGIQVASGSACSTDSLEPSHVLLAMGIAQECAHGSLRFSLSKDTTRDDLAKVIKIVPPQIAIIRAMSPTWSA